MIGKNSIRLGFLNFIRNKTKKFYVLIIIICFVLCIGSITFSLSISNFINENYKKNIDFRTLSIVPKFDEKDNGFGEIQRIPHIIEVYSSKYNQFSAKETSLKSETLNGEIDLLYGTPDILPAIIEGRGFKENEKNVAICPKNFYPDSSLRSNKMNIEFLIDGSELLNEEFVVKYNSYNWDTASISIDKTYNKAFKIVGLYDNKSVMKQNNQCYISSSDIVEIIDTSTNTNIKSDVVIVENLNAVVDSIENIANVQENLNNSNFNGSTIFASVDVEMINTLILASIALLSITLFIIIMVTAFYTKKAVINNKKNIGVMKAFGYNSASIWKVYISEFIITNIVCSIIGILISFIVCNILKKNILSSFIYSGMNIDINFKTIIISFIVIIVLTIITASYQLYKNEKQSIINLMGSK